MNLQTVIKGLAISDRRGRFSSKVSGVSNDSRTVESGNIFVAVRGSTADGHKFISDAIKRGAVAVIAEEWDDAYDISGEPVDVVLVPNSRKALSVVAANYYGRPSQELQVSGVTGTNGKTTVSYLVESIVQTTGRTPGVIGTIEARYGEKKFSLKNTTPGPIELQKTLANMRDAGVSHAVLEVSSHALHQERAYGIDFKVASFTNLTQDHLDYHGSMDSYYAAKSRLFSEVLAKSQARGRIAVVNLDDPKGQDLVKLWEGKTLTVSLSPDSGADVRVLESEMSLDGVQAKIATLKGTWDLRTQLIGEHNLSNVCVAFAMALGMGFTEKHIVEGVKALAKVPGRLERIPDSKGRSVFVDYAHTPDALRATLEAVRPHTKGRLIIVFGAAGGRDVDKRPLMGEEVGKLADLVFVTNDNSRGENPETIAEHISKGLKKSGVSSTENLDTKGYIWMLDRQLAIRSAIEVLQSDDVLVIAGKGHETTQTIGDKKYYFDDREITRKALNNDPEEPLKEVSEEDAT